MTARRSKLISLGNADRLGEWGGGGATGGVITSVGQRRKIKDALAIALKYRNDLKALFQRESLFNRPRWGSLTIQRNQTGWIKKNQHGSNWFHCKYNIHGMQPYAHWSCWKHWERLEPYQPPPREGH